MSFGEFLSQILEWLYRFWPMRIVHDWEQGVRCRFGNATSLLTSSNGIFETGFHVFWPVIGEINVYETNIEVSETELQTQTSRDGTPVTFSLGVKYRIFDLKRMYQSIHDPRETIQNEICSAAGRCIAVSEYAELSDRLCDRVMQEVKAQMGEWGIEISSISLINLTSAQPLRLILDRNREADFAP